jgi:oxygen-independent coproporphyrinogen-3 oxidase
VSIGAQSFDRGELRVLERIHRPEQVAETIRSARAAGIGEVNVDLIFAIPGQSLEAWLRNLHEALALGVDHLSCYGLTYERGTPLFEQLRAGQVRRADADLEADMYEATIETLAAAGFEQYEISNFARPGRRCRHNLVYWRNQAYLGLGPSASGFVGEVRYKNIPDTAEYVRCIEAGRSPRIQQERLSLDHRARETVMLQLRLIEGVDRSVFRARFGRDPVEMFADVVERHAALGLLRVDEPRVALTRHGLLVADSVMADFLAPAVV